MVPVEQHQKTADSGGEQQQPILREGIRVQLSTTILDTKLVLLLLIVSIEWPKIDIRGGLVDSRVAMRSSEDAVQLEFNSNSHIKLNMNVPVNDKCREREHQGGKTTRVLHELKNVLVYHDFILR